MTVAINYTILEIFNFVGGEWLSGDFNSSLEFLSLDSRKISEPSKTVFWAISSESRDGSRFIEALYRSGVRNFVTQKRISVRKLKGANVLLVPDSLDALQALAAAHRRRFKNIHVIGITGSNGKTVVKEWLSELLSPRYSVIKSPRSYNSQIGVPLSILQIRGEHQIGIFEAGISMPGEMRKLEKMILPDTGIFTNIGTAHDEGFNSRRQKVREKLLLFRNVKSLVYPGDEKEIAGCVDSTKFLTSVRKICWGTQDCKYQVQPTRRYGNRSVINIISGDDAYKLSVPFTDNASVDNAISCFCGIRVSGFYSSDVLKSFTGLRAVSMRLEMKPGIHHCEIINDSYSNDLQSLAVAVDFLKQQSHKQTTVILSDLLQTGLAPEKLYKRVAEIMEQKKIDRVIAIGKGMSANSQLFNKIPARHFFSSTEAFLKRFSRFSFHDESILVKGARKFSFEKISRLLEAQLHQTVFAVNLSNLSHNIRVYKSLLKPDTRLMAMVKAFAYGLGIEQIGSLLQHIEVDYLAVAYADEGVALREAGIKLPIMVLNIEAESFDNLVRYNLEPEVFSFEMLATLSSFLSQKKITLFPVHIKIDTGMHRLGFEKNDIGKLVKELKENNRVKVKTVFTHLSSSDNPAHDLFTREQSRLFKKIVSRIRNNLSYPFDCHLANTAAISRFPELQMDMVRLGIGMYGVDDNPKLKDKLKVVNQLTTTVSQIKKVKAGEVVGYGRNVVKDDKIIATVRIGYADGYPRLLGNGTGRMLVHGKPAPTVGSICMDMTMLDVTRIPDVNEGDEVLVFGEALPVQKVAGWARTIPYEIFTGISPRVRRVYFEE